MPQHPLGGVRLATASGFQSPSEQPLTHRRDGWWLFPLFTLVVYVAFIAYGVFRFLQPVLSLGPAFAFPDGVSSREYFSRYYIADNGNYHYLAPFGTPDLTFLVPSILWSVHPFIEALLRNPAFVILPFPALFRFTCYYYRKSYYRAFVARPYACTVPAFTGVNYKGERGLMALQNLHRYALYAAIIITIFLAYDAVRSIVTPHGLYFGFGSALMLVNVVLLMLYTFGCHSWRHLVGGKLDMYSCEPLARWRYGLWSRVTMMNERHALWAWLSMISVAATDYYIYWLAQNPQTHLFGMVPV